jgi:hypothetical protein
MVSCFVLTTEVWIQSHVRFMVENVQVFLWAFQFSSAIYHSTNAPYLSSPEAGTIGLCEAAVPKGSVLPHYYN